MRPHPDLGIDGPHFKGPDYYLTADSDNPRVPWPGYGWPLGSVCWYFIVGGSAEHGWRRYATGATVAEAWRRAIGLVPVLNELAEWHHKRVEEDERVEAEWAELAARVQPRPSEAVSPPPRQVVRSRWSDAGGGWRRFQP